MYKDYFGFREVPFSIVPNAQTLFLSQRHKEAITHLNAGLGEGGGFALLTGEVGTGKTTVARVMMSTLDDATQAGFILNPTFSEIELLQAICDEFDIEYKGKWTLKKLNQAIYQHLMENHANGRQTLLVIDEAQHLSFEVMEQLRLLTNLETQNHKLLKVLLVGQPELQGKLSMPHLRQFAQRITGRYHLMPLNGEETKGYIYYRLDQADGNSDLFSHQSIKYIAKVTQGIPRLINLVCDGALKQAYFNKEVKPSIKSVIAAAESVMALQSGFIEVKQTSSKPLSKLVSALCLAIGMGGAYMAYQAFPIYINPYIEEYVESQYPLTYVEPQQVEQLPQSLFEALDKSFDRSQAITELYKVWGYRANALESYCEQSKRTLFSCQSQVGSIQDILALNLPVVLTLYHNNSIGYGVLYKGSQEQVELLLSGERWTIDTPKLKSLWRGEYLVIWQSQWSDTLSPGMKGESIGELDRRLSLVLQVESEGKNTFDEVLRKKVEQFQHWNNLAVDGIAGENTLNKLELMTQENAPRLKERS